MDKEDKNRLKELEQVLSKEEIAEALKNRRVELDTDIEETQHQIDNCHDDQQEDLEKQMMEYQKLRKELYPSDEEEESSMEGDEKSQENDCKDKKMRDMEQGPETTGVNNGDGLSSAKMDEDGDEEKEDKRMSDDEIS